MSVNCVVCDNEFDSGPLVYEICRSCGIQFGYDDAAGDDPEVRYVVYSEWRKAWNANNKQKLSNEQIDAVHETINSQLNKPSN